jgi:hypothetical protein
VKQWKIAVSFAVIGAVVGPFLLGTWKIRPMSETWVPLTAEERGNISSHVEGTNSCQTSPSEIAKFSCFALQRLLEEGGESRVYPSLSKYLALNAAAAIAGFACLFGLTFLLPAVVRRYWKWLRT